ncbi:hypothetical protein TSUD_104310 [Trifolium subterraneum]|uniref:Uncharacterized protein n=1 Tax=Trifolium subterraneum TaxID=3900 RepID=A0A2Z6MPK1_TRISU|nr:hypothetical protein TSUD_104310 [Trifolium subterraneum]
MTMTKTILVVFLSALLICSLSTHDVEAREIDYDAMKKDTIPCNKENAVNCKEDIPANTYTRGCSKINRCRDGNK